MDMQLTNINISDIKIEHRVREELGDLSALESSIKEVGLLFPIVVSRDNVLVSGLRRIKACQNLGYVALPALVVDAPAGVTSLDMECHENLCRKTLTNIELDKVIEMKKNYLARDEREKRKGLWGKLINKIRSWRVS